MVTYNLIYEFNSILENISDLDLIYDKVESEYFITQIIKQFNIS